MISKLKLRHLDLLIEDKIDYATLMVELNGYKNTWWNKKFLFIKSFKETFQFIEYIKILDPKLIKLNPDCKIRLPEAVDNISFLAMMELHSLTNSENEMSISQLMARTIAIACFSENNETLFDIDSIIFKEFEAIVYESSAIDMMGLSNWIELQLKESTKMWQQKFFEIEVIDKDYQQAEGSRMDAFNIVNTIKSICSDFGYNEKEAWQVSYSLTQANSLSKATAAFVQNNMSQIKEARMKANRKNK